MKKIENNFAVTGFVGKDAEIRQFANASVGSKPTGEERRGIQPRFRLYEL